MLSQPGFRINQFSIDQQVTSRVTAGRNRSIQVGMKAGRTRCPGKAVYPLPGVHPSPTILAGHRPYLRIPAAHTHRHGCGGHSINQGRRHKCWKLCFFVLSLGNRIGLILLASQPSIMTAFTSTIQVTIKGILPRSHCSRAMTLHFQANCTWRNEIHIG